MDEHDSERLKASVGEYLEALERLDLLRPRMLLRPHDVTPSSEDLADCWNAAAAVKCALRGLRQTYRECGGEPGAATSAECDEVVSRGGLSSSHAAPLPLRTWPLGSGQRV